MNLDVSNDIINMIYDIIKFSIIQITSHFLFIVMGNSELRFFNPIFFQTLIFINLGLMIFWLLIKKIIKFNNDIKKLKKSLKK
tara:strand:+ start:496 stop:744 length:249 start_codon:yes stop_codon:yes gene_type:complete